METERTPIANTVWSFIRTIIVLIFSIGIVVAAVLFAVNKSPQKSIFGYRYYTVLTPSMNPTYKVGDLVFVKLSHAEDIAIDDVITFNPSSETDAYLTHRVIDKIEDYEGSGVTCFRTKGDANETEDDFLIDEPRVIGKVSFAIPKLGYIIRFIQLKWYFVLPLVILTFVFLRLVDTYLDSREEDLDADADDNPTDMAGNE